MAAKVDGSGVSVTVPDKITPLNPVSFITSSRIVWRPASPRVTGGGLKSELKSLAN